MNTFYQLMFLQFKWANLTLVTPIPFNIREHPLLIQVNTPFTSREYPLYSPAVYNALTNSFNYSSLEPASQQGLTASLVSESLQK